MGPIIPFRRRTRLPKEWAPYRASRRRWRESRLMVEAGLLIGLAVFNIAQFAGANVLSPASVFVAEASAAFEVPQQTVNPYATSEQSRAILAAQEGAPAIALASTARGEFARSAAVRVSDGDTFDYRGERIRIADIDTPEVRGRCPEERAQAALATQRLRTLLAAGPFEL